MIDATLALSLALASLQPSLATMAQLKTQSQVPPAPAGGPVSRQAQWEAIMEAVLSKGTSAPIPGTGLVRHTKFFQLDAADGSYYLFIIHAAVRPIANAKAPLVGADLVVINHTVDRVVGHTSDFMMTYSTDGGGKLLSVTAQETTTKLQPPGSEPVKGPARNLHINSRLAIDQFEYAIYVWANDPAALR